MTMIFFAQKVLRKMQGHWTYVVVTDRKELDTKFKNPDDPFRIVSSVQCGPQVLMSLLVQQFILTNRNATIP